MSLHQTNKDKPRALKCHHFCFSFNLHNYCPTCREAGKDDDPCVTFETPCDICASFTDDQMKKIQHRKRYLKNKKRKLVLKIMNLIFWAMGIPTLAQMQSNADLERAAGKLFTSPPPPPILSPLLSVLYLLKHQPNLSHPPQVLSYNKKLKQILKIPGKFFKYSFTATNGFLSGIHVGSFSVAPRGVDF